MATAHIVKEVSGYKRYFDEAICTCCGNTFLKRAEAKNIYCSKQCAGISRKKMAPKTHHHICAYCGKDFETIKNYSKYCSKGCFAKSLVKNKAAICEYCGKPFEKTRAGKKYCSTICSAKARKTGSVYKCETCGADVYRTPTTKKTHVFCRRECRDEWTRTHDGILRNNGISNQSGYVFVRQGKKIYRGEHRLIMEAHLGRKLRSDEIVHHIDHDKTNNDISNLMIVTRAEHIRLHKKELHAWHETG